MEICLSVNILVIHYNAFYTLLLIKAPQNGAQRLTEVFLLLKSCSGNALKHDKGFKPSRDWSAVTVSSVLFY